MKKGKTQETATKKNQATKVASCDTDLLIKILKSILAHIFEGLYYTLANLEPDVATNLLGTKIDFNKDAESIILKLKARNDEDDEIEKDYVDGWITADERYSRHSTTLQRAFRDCLIAEMVFANYQHFHEINGYYLENLPNPTEVSEQIYKEVNVRLMTEIVHTLDNSTE